MKKKKILGIILIILLGLFSFNYVIIRADSGFDVSYDGGGSDFSSSSDWSSSSDYGSGGSGGEFSLKLFLIWAAIVIVLMVAVIIIDKKYNTPSRRLKRRLELHKKIDERTNKMYNKLNASAMGKFNKFFPNDNIENYYKYVAETFVKIQEAWTNFDYDTLRDLLTDELYNSYQMQLKTLTRKKQVNKMHDFITLDTKLIDLDKSKDIYTFKFLLVEAFYDYIVDKDGRTLHGSQRKRVKIRYEITMVGIPNADSNKCPNCGNILDESASNICPSCNSVIVSRQHKLVMSKKENKDQGWYNERRDS